MQIKYSVFLIRKGKTWNVHAHEHFDREEPFKNVYDRVQNWHGVKEDEMIVVEEGVLFTVLGD